VQLAVTRLAVGGDGIGRAPDGRVVLCEGALPGETVDADVVDERRDFLRARVAAVLVPSPARRAPACPQVAAGCGGCTFAHVAPSAEGALKAGMVVDALTRLAHRPDVAVRVFPGAVPDHGYRTTVHLAVDEDGRPAYRRRHGRDLVPTATCRVAHPLLEELVVDGRFPGAHEVLLRVSVATGGRLACPDRVRPGVRVPDGTLVTRAGDRRAVLHEDVADRRWRVSAAAFFQSGPAAAAALVEAVAASAGVGPGARIVDLYAGIGLLGGALAARGGARGLVAVESGAAAARDAFRNLADLGATVVQGEVAQAARRLAHTPEFRGADVVIADPPRTGLGPSAAAAVAALGAPCLVLVSCDPASLARDATLLAADGYAIDDVAVVDVFPSTFHVETVSRFRVAR